MGMTQYYEIRVRSHLDASWSDWLGGLTIRHDANGESLLITEIVDQSALHGMLNRLRDMGVILISVNPVATPSEPNQEEVDPG
jgi:hypothetical protein